MGIELGRYLRKCRLAAGVTQREVSGKLGHTTAQYVSNIERGVSRPPKNWLRTYCRVVGANPLRVREMWVNDVRSELNGVL